MKAELLERKQADLDKGRTTNTYTSPNPAPRRKRSGCATATMWGIVAIFGMAIIFSAIDDAKTPNKGYYDYNGTPYYYSGSGWYTPDDDGDWERTYNAPGSLEENYNDYFEAKDYYDLDSDYADDIEEYQTEAYSYNYDDDDDSWNDSNWDDDDGDYDDWDEDDWDFDYDD